MARRRFVFSTFGSLGDLHPYLAVARELRARGHDPVIATSAVYREKVEAEGFGFAAIRPDESDFGDPEEVFRRANRPLLGTPFIFNQMILPHLRASYDDLLAASEGADVLVSQTLTFAVPLVAEKRGLPWAGTLLQPIALLSECDPPVVGAAPWLPRLRQVSPPLYHFIMGAARRYFARLGRPIGRLRRELGLGPAPADPLLAGQFSPHLNLAMFSPVLAAPQPDWPPATLTTGFAFFDRGQVGYEQPDARLAAFLDSGPPPVVFTLGSAIVRSQRSFFPETFSLLRTPGVRAVVVTGHEPRNQPSEPLPAGVLAVPYAPYGALFHRAAVIVHHGGIGTTAQALRAGRPQLIVPFAHDQPDNAARVARLGAGLTVAPRRYAAVDVARLLRILLADTAISRRAAEAGAVIRSEHGAAAAADALESLLR